MLNWARQRIFRLRAEVFSELYPLEIIARTALKPISRQDLRGFWLDLPLVPD